MAGKLSFPKFLAGVPCVISVYSGGLGEDGSPSGEVVWSGKCVFNEKSESDARGDRLAVKSLGSVYVEGDTAPDITGSDGGTITLYPGTEKEAKMRVWRVEKPRNPDGTVNHTKFYLI
jgi:hypothetical protein